MIADVLVGEKRGLKLPDSNKALRLRAHHICCMRFWRVAGSEAKISLRVYPGAARSEVVGFSDGVLQVRVAAPPVKGQANKELIAFLSKALAVGKGALTIVKGHTSRNKVIAIDGLSQEDIIKRLSSKPFSSGGDTSSKLYHQ